MDPDAALDELITAILLGDFERALQALLSLRSWQEAKGFAPKDPRAGRDQPAGPGWGQALTQLQQREYEAGFFTGLHDAPHEGSLSEYSQHYRNGHAQGTQERRRRG